MSHFKLEAMRSIKHRSRCCTAWFWGQPFGLTMFRKCCDVEISHVLGICFMFFILLEFIQFATTYNKFIRAKHFHYILSTIKQMSPGWTKEAAFGLLCCQGAGDPHPRVWDRRSMDHHCFLCISGLLGWPCRQPHGAGGNCFFLLLFGWLVQPSESI